MIRRTARAKLNLALHVRHRRPDGYHELETLFAFVDHGDRLTVEPAAQADFSVTGPFAAALSGEGDNLVLRAERAFRARIAPLPPLAITLDKQVPVASGIGGGSADAAAMLALAAGLAGIDPRDPRLFALAGDLGSDVPACLDGRSAVGRGRGEALSPVAGAPAMPVLLVNPGVAVSTAQVFAAWDGRDAGPLPPGDLISAARAGTNNLEPVALGIAPVIGHVIALLSDQPGVVLARMSGSGATCFALFDTAANAAGANARIRDAHPDWWCLETALV